jgi:hypothetical protein
MSKRNLPVLGGVIPALITRRAIGQINAVLTATVRNLKGMPGKSEEVFFFWLIFRLLFQQNFYNFSAQK